MSFYICKALSPDMNFESVIEKATQELKKEDFDILTEIDLKSTFKNNL